MRTVNFSDAHANFKKVADQVAGDHVATLIQRRDAEDVVLIPASDYRSMQEAIYLLSSKDNAARLMEAMVEADHSLPPGARILGL